MSLSVLQIRPKNSLNFVVRIKYDLLFCLVECQYLCKITKYCLYFNHDPLNNKETGKCWLKYGIGKFDSTTNFTFGQKNNEGLCIEFLSRPDLIDMFS